MVREISYEVPAQDLRMDLARIPALPASGFVVKNLVLHDAGGHA
jgi:fatty-acid peroxygenase